MRISEWSSDVCSSDLIVIGEHEEIRVDDVAVVPALLSLFSDTRVLSRVKVDKPIIKKAALDILDKLAEGKEDEPERPAAVSVREIEVNDAKQIGRAHV